VNYSSSSTATVSDSVDDPIQKLLKTLLATDDVAEFDSLCARLRSLLNERIEQLRKDAKSLKPNTKISDRRKRPRNGAPKP
jgi:hypothetical protein